MNLRKTILGMLIGFTGLVSNIMAKNTNEEYRQDQIRSTKFYKKVAISSVEFQNESGSIAYKIIISNMEKNINAENKLIPGKIVWEISYQLPLTKKECIAAYADPCDKGLTDLYNGSCFMPCITYGPEPIAFDEKANKLYLAASSANIGTGGGPYFTFVADVNKKEIKFLKAEHGPFDASLSPFGTFLLLYGNNSIRVYNRRGDLTCIFL